MGASANAGFSTTSTTRVPSTAATPLVEISGPSMRIRAMVERPVASVLATISASAVLGWKMSSGRSTANGSSPTAARAMPTA